MTKTTTVALLTMLILVTGIIAGPMGLFQPADALKSKGTKLTETGSDKVCGDRLCSQVPKDGPKEEKKKEQVKTQKKTEAAEKAMDVPKKDTKSQTMEQAKMASTQTVRTPKIVSGSMVSSTDPGIGHETHQLALILPPSEKIYRGQLTYVASENVQLVALHGPLADGKSKGQAIWTPDGETIYGLTFVDPEKTAGVWQFTGNALAVHTKNEKPFTVTYSVSYTEHVVDDQKIIRGTMTSEQDPGLGHENHQLAVILPPREKPYSGHLTYDASEPIQLVTLVGPVPPKHQGGQALWTPDGNTQYALILMDPKKSAGSWVFSGNALAVHTMNDVPFTVSYSVVLTE